MAHTKARVVWLAALMVLFGGLATLTLNGTLSSFEDGVYTLFSRYTGLPMTRFMLAVTHMGSVYTVAAVIMVFLLLPYVPFGTRVSAAVCAAVSAAGNNLLKIAIARDRPVLPQLVAETGYSFPSGHAMNNAAMYTIMILIVFRATQKWSARAPVLAAGILLPFAIGVSRVYLGVHSAGDILAGWVLGAAVALLTDTAAVALSRRSEAKTP